MRLRVPAAAFALSAASLLAPAPAVALCSTASAGARCIRVLEAAPLRPVAAPESVRASASASSPLADVGDVLPRGQYSIILNADYYGLPPVSDGWVYMRVGHDAFRVDWQTHQILERVTDRTAANF